MASNLAQVQKRQQIEKALQTVRKSADFQKSRQDEMRGMTDEAQAGSGTAGLMQGQKRNPAGLMQGQKRNLAGLMQGQETRKTTCLYTISR